MSGAVTGVGSCVSAHIPNDNTKNQNRGHCTRETEGMTLLELCAVMGPIREIEYKKIFYI